MPVNVIGTLKPKNNGKFPVAEAVDIKVTDDLRLDEALENKADNSSVNFALNQKADKNTTNSLQSQINELVTPVTEDAEVQNARVGATGKTYTTLKERIDSTELDFDDLKSNLYNNDNLLLTSEIIENKYYVGHEFDDDRYSYAIVPMSAAKSYIISAARFIAYSTGNAIASNTIDGYEFSPEADTDVYISFYNDTTSHSEWKVYEKGKDGNKIGTYQHPTLSESVLGNTDNLAAELVNYSNIFDTCLMYDNKYYYGGAFIPNTDYVVFSFDAEAGSSYQFGCTLRFLATSTVNIGANLAEKYIYTPEQNETLYVSVKKDISDKWKAVKLPDDIDAVNGKGIFSFNPNLIAHESGNSKTLVMSQQGVSKLVGIKDKIYGKGFAQITGDLSDGDILTLPKSNIKKNNVYSFMAYITSFNTLLIGHGKNHYEDSWIEINDSKVIVHNYLTSDSTTEYEHGLTISNYIYVQIIVTVNSADIIIYSDGSTYKITEATWYGDGTGDTFAESDGSTLTDCVLTWSSSDIRKSVWLFGDSYFGMANSARWVKYLIDSGYGDNVLLNAFPGEATGNAVIALNNLIQHYGKPNFIVWCLGMNDGSDTDEDTPSTSWLTGVNRVLQICKDYSIIPIFATIPTVPNIYHEGKNKYVRNSGHRYIDFAKAVGASGDGTWFNGMLSQDGVHPDVAGAIALYHRAIADCPEITFENP